MSTALSIKPTPADAPQSMAMKLLVRGLLPDTLVRYGIRRLLVERLREEDKGEPGAQRRHLMELVERLKASPIAINTGEANEQHYELPCDFFQKVLGPHLKYSSCYYLHPADTLEQAEARMLALTAERARLKDGDRILELGCGWGSLSLWMAGAFPNSTITAVSNSRTQKQFIDARAAERGLKNLTIVTSDMNVLDFPGGTAFDRVVSVEMFEHMRNWPALLERIRTWLHPSGKLFLHVFSHAQFAYPYEDRGPGDWMARYFFTGGIMPSHRMIYNFNEDLQVEKDWRINGNHYSRTLEDWLKNLDANRKPALALFDQVYGPSESLKWLVRWRVFLMACSELFSYRGGEEWGVSHYLLQCS